MFIIANDSIVAKISGTTTAKARDSVRYSTQRSEEAVNASREWNLVNASNGTISDANKWHKQWDRMCGAEQEDCGIATEMNPGEFFIR